MGRISKKVNEKSQKEIKGYMTKKQMIQPFLVKTQNITMK